MKYGLSVGRIKNYKPNICGHVGGKIESWTKNKNDNLANLSKPGQN